MNDCWRSCLSQEMGGTRKGALREVKERAMGVYRKPGKETTVMTEGVREQRE